MSKVKSPQDKKRLSLQLDCRNIYGEKAKSSRKNIAKGKQRSHRKERRVAKAPLLAIKDAPDEAAAVEFELKAKVLALQAQRSSFKKTADAPLGVVLKRQKATGTKWLAVPI